MKDRINLLTILLIGLFALIFARIVYIDFFSKNKEKLAYAQTDLVTYERGVIKDRNGNDLAVSIRQTSVAINPARINVDRLKDYAVLCNLLGIEYSYFRALVKKDSKFLWLKRKVDDGTIEKIRKLELPGLQYLPEYKRYYPNQHLASHVIGCVGVDNYGLEGIELFFNEELKGNYSDLDFQKDKTSKRSVYKFIEGKSVILTIDKHIQHAVEKELQNAYTAYQPESITAIVMDPNTGEILAMANLPDFDPNNMNLFSPSSLKNRAISDYYEPGSVFKVITTAMLLTSGKFPLGQSYQCEGSIKIGKNRIKCWKTHGRIAYEDVLRYSCNTALINLTLNSDARTFYTFVRNFGFGSMTGVELPGESKGLLRPYNQWTYYSKASIAIGQEIGVTPLQMLTALCAFANGGNLLHPHIVNEIRYADGTLYKKYSTLAIRNVVSPVVIREVRDFMVKVTEKGGTGERASILKYRIAGKTGTSQVFDNANRRYYADKHILSFAGFYPAENPEIAMIVIVRKPRNMVDATGGLIAAPIFKEIALKINSYRNIIPIENVITAGESISAPKGKSGKDLPEKMDFVPDYSGLNMRQTMVLIDRTGMTPNLIGSGIAYKQYPQPGTRIDKKIPMTIWFK
jgi:cell division protein FtsI/penicillin-binding protein 2